MRALAILLLTVAPVLAEPVRLVPYTLVEERVVTRVDFEEFPRRMSPGLPVDDLQRVEGAVIGERFAGQQLTQIGGFDVLTPTPVGPLSLQPGAAGQNLSLTYLFQLSTHIEGLAPPGYPDYDASGEGAISILFDRDQFALGFRVAAEPPPKDGAGVKGEMTVDFFRRDGSLIATLPVTLDWGREGYGFYREGEITDIAGITITNRDPQGVAIDDLIFDQDLIMSEFTGRERAFAMKHIIHAGETHEMWR